MVANPRRRVDVTDAALRILGHDGSRALTHRAVDAAAQLPAGTCANYFPSRAALLLAMAQRIFERLAPDPSELQRLTSIPHDDALPEYVGYVVERLIRSSDLARALIELRLEAARSEEISAVVTPILRQGLIDDVSFHRERGFYGGQAMVTQLHHLVNGILLDHLTAPLDPTANPVGTAKDAARALALGWPSDETSDQPSRPK